MSALLLAAAVTTSATALGGPFDSMSAYCKALRKQGENRCGDDRDIRAAKARAMPPGMVSARAFATVARGEVAVPFIHLNLALRTAAGLYVHEMFALAWDPGECCARESDVTKIEAWHGLLRVEYRESETIKYSGNGTSSSAPGDQLRFFFLCGLGANGQPACTGPRLAARNGQILEWAIEGATLHCRKVPRDVRLFRPDWNALAADLSLTFP